MYVLNNNYYLNIYVNTNPKNARYENEEAEASC